MKTRKELRVEIYFTRQAAETLQEDFDFKNIFDLKNKIVHDLLS